MGKPKLNTKAIRAEVDALREGQPRKLTITLSKTATGDRDYLQVLSADGWSLNIVLIADSIEVKDSRP